jgi:aryl-alcohol dehydrogenase-like predicted oxidoreductase
MATPFALGTYRISDQDPIHIKAIKTAVTEGVTLIDTSTNYMDGGAERAIGVARAMMDDEAWRSVRIVSKFGYVQGSMMQRLKEEETFNNVVKYTEQVWHCIDPEFMHDQLTQTLKRLECPSIDCYLLHNPEYFLLDAINRGVSLEARLDEMLQRIHDVFIGLENEVSAGRISSYGISSNSFSKPCNDPEFLPYEDLVALAQSAAKAAGNPAHHFTTIQLPINRLETEGLRCAQWAKAHGLRVLANRPLNAQHEGRMYRLAEYDEPSEYYYALNELMGIAEENGIDPLYNLLQELDGNKHRFHWIGDYEHFYYVQVIPVLRTILQKLDETMQQSLAEGLSIFLDEYRKMVEYECSRRTREELSEMFAECDRPLQVCALEFLQQDAIDYILVGMRKPRYVHEVLSL